jgi:hypothetical protein
VGWDWVHLVRRPLSGLLYQPRMIDEVCGAVGIMRIGRRNRSTRRKPAPAPLFPPQIPHELTWDGTRAAAVGSQRVTASAMARPSFQFLSVSCMGQIVALLKTRVDPSRTFLRRVTVWLNRPTSYLKIPYHLETVAVAATIHVRAEDYLTTLFLMQTIWADDHVRWNERDWGAIS